MAKKNHVGYLSSDNGPGIVNGLNIMAACVQNPLCKEALRKTMMQVHLDSGIPFPDLFEDLETAINHIDAINKMVQDCGVKRVGEIDNV